MAREIDPDRDPAPEGVRVPPALQGFVAELGVHGELAVLDGERAVGHRPDRPGDGQLAEDGVDDERPGLAFHPSAAEGQDQPFGGPCGLLEIGLEAAARLREELEAAAKKAHGRPRKDEGVRREASRKGDPAVLALQAALAAHPPPPVERQVQDLVQENRVGVEAGREVDLRVEEPADPSFGRDGQARPFDGQALDREVLALARDENGQAAE